ncbi:hypothetical protein [Clostridium diolis]|uniref:hypothetical protein n=1 Tax=Clostridium diolis TaxID=223919 RepID=UPI003AF9B837
MIELNYIRDFLVAMTTIITVLGVFVKTLNKFFLETIKSRYKMIPGKQSIFDTVLKSIMVFISTVSIIFSFIMVTYSLVKKGSNLNANELLNLSANIYEFIGFGVAMLFYYLLYGTLDVFSRLQSIFVDKFEKKSTENQRESKNLKKSMYSFLKHIGSKLNIFKNIGIKKLNIINLIISAFLGSCSLILIVSYILKGIKKEDLESVFILVMIGMFSLISFIISISLLNVVEIVNSNCIYKIVMEQEIIICRCYLEYDEHYLVLENGNERYISKGKVKEIIKSKGFGIEILRN